LFWIEDEVSEGQNGTYTKDPGEILVNVQTGYKYHVNDVNSRDIKAYQVVLSTNEANSCIDILNLFYSYDNRLSWSRDMGLSAYIKKTLIMNASEKIFDANYTDSKYYIKYAWGQALGDTANIASDIIIIMLKAYVIDTAKLRMLEAPSLVYGRTHNGGYVV
jgi:hypothetical protein